MSSIEKGKEGMCSLSVLKVRSSLVFVHQIIVPVTEMSLLMLPLLLHSPPQRTKPSQMVRSEPMQLCLTEMLLLVLDGRFLRRTQPCCLRIPPSRCHVHRCQDRPIGRRGRRKPCYDYPPHSATVDLCKIDPEEGEGADSPVATTPLHVTASIFVKIDAGEGEGADSPGTTTPSIAPPSIIDLTCGRKYRAPTALLRRFPDSGGKEEGEFCIVICASRSLSVSAHPCVIDFTL